MDKARKLTEVFEKAYQHLKDPADKRKNFIPPDIENVEDGSNGYQGGYYVKQIQVEGKPLKVYDGASNPLPSEDLGANDDADGQASSELDLQAYRHKDHYTHPQYTKNDHEITERECCLADYLSRYAIASGNKVTNFDYVVAHLYVVCHWKPSEII